MSGRSRSRGKSPYSEPLVSVIMAVYNEENTVEIIIKDLLSRHFEGFIIELIIIESNSTDKSRFIVSRFATDPRVKIIYQDKANGKGSAIRLGLEVAEGDTILIQDADLEYDIADYPRLLEPILSEGVPFVLGSRSHGGPIRTMPGEKVASYITNFGHSLFTGLFNFIYRQDLKDPFTMYKVFRADCISELTFTANRFDFDWELLGKLCRRGFTPIEIPITYRSRGFKSGKKVRLLRDPLTWIIAAIRYRFEPLT